MSAMTNRERMLGVIQGKKHDRVPFVQYDGISAPNQEVWDVIGRNNMGVLRWSGVSRVEHPNCHIDTEELERDGKRVVRHTLHTPEGKLTEDRISEPNLGTSRAVEHYIKEPGDYGPFMAYLRDAKVHLDVEHFYRDQRDLGDDGLPMVSLGRTPYQQLWVQWVCLEDLALHFMDCPDTMEEVVSLMTRILRDTFEMVRQAVQEAPIPFINFGDNITAPTIGVRNFREYCVPLYNELADVIADKGIPVFVHMDGDLKPLWDAIGESKVRGIDSFSPPPDNDTSPAQALKLWPEMRLLVNYPSSVHLAEPEKIYQRAMQILEEAGHSGQLQIQISENAPPGRWRTSYPEIVRAISDFGAP